ncbi:MAG: hypothetical protein HC834_03320 [Rhodospirillales bacterium]|nr:hypothetical protein [Rhodospirillales bacterium]
MQSLTKTMLVLGMALALIFVSLSSVSNAQAADEFSRPICALSLDADGKAVSMFEVEEGKGLESNKAAAECLSKLQSALSTTIMESGIGSPWDLEARRLCCWGGSCRRC